MPLLGCISSRRGEAERSVRPRSHSKLCFYSCPVPLPRYVADTCEHCRQAQPLLTPGTNLQNRPASVTQKWWCTMQVLGTRTLQGVHNPTWHRGKHCHYDAGGNPLALRSQSVSAGIGETPGASGCTSSCVLVVQRQMVCHSHCRCLKLCHAASSKLSKRYTHA